MSFDSIYEYCVSHFRNALTNGCKEKKIVLVIDCCNRYIVLKADKIIKESMCDCIIFCQLDVVDENVMVFVVELKKTSEDASTIEKNYLMESDL